MNGTRTGLTEMVHALADVESENTVILCVPYTMLGLESGRVALGAQDTSAHDHGAYTGEVSASMIADTGAKYVIVGHSERRQYHGETNDIVRQKAAAALANGLTPIICVGETMDEKQAGKTMEIIESGVRESIPTDARNVIVAYEPRWAIGAGLTPHGRHTDIIRRQCQGHKRCTNYVYSKCRRRIGWWCILETRRFHTYNNQC